MKSYLASSSIAASRLRAGTGGCYDAPDDAKNANNFNSSSKNTNNEVDYLSVIDEFVSHSPSASSMASSMFAHAGFEGKYGTRATISVFGGYFFPACASGDRTAPVWNLIY